MAQNLIKFLELKTTNHEKSSFFTFRYYFMLM